MEGFIYYFAENSLIHNYSKYPLKAAIITKLLAIELSIILFFQKIQHCKLVDSRIIII